MEYMSAPQAAEKWGISERRVQILCSENRIPGVSKLGYMWLHLSRQNRLLLYFGAEAACHRQRVRRLSVWAGVSLHRLVYKRAAALYGPLERA